MLKSNTARLFVLTLVHFTVDFYGGLAVPLSEPTLTRHLDVELPVVAALIGGFAIFVNVVQPVSGWLLPKRGLPLLILVAPIAAAFHALIGLTHSLVIVGLMMLVATLGTGIVHPEAALAAHSIAGRKKGLGMSIFMSGGYFGFASGILASGVWVEHRDQGLANFWLLALPALAVAALVFAARLHKIEGHFSEGGTTDTPGLSFWPVLALASSIAITMCVFIRFMPILLVRRFPDQDPQRWAGIAGFATGIAGALGSWLWGSLSSRRNTALIIAGVQVLCIPFFYMLMHIESATMAPVWSLGIGLSIGAVFPLAVVLARRARGPSQRLKMGLAIGGAFGLGETSFILGGLYVGRFPEADPAPVSAVLSVCWLLMFATAVLGLVVAAAERRATAS